MEEQNRYSRDIGEGVRQFIATSASEALKQVRAELGPDALIITQDRVGDRVVIEAALELPEITAIPERGEHTETAEAFRGNGDEVGVAEQSSELSHASASENPQDEQCETGDQEVDINVAGVPMSALRGCYRFIGGSGVGKTSLLIKTAVEHVMVHGTQGLVVVATDHERLAGSEQLELSCQMLGIKLVTRSAANLLTTVDTFQNKDLILVDTTAAELSEPEPIAGIADVFVCSAEHSIQSLDAQRQLCRQPSYTAVTHLDRPGDHRAIGHWLSVTGQKLLAMGTSGYLPEGLEMASQETVQKHFFTVGENAEGLISVSV